MSLPAQLKQGFNRDAVLAISEFKREPAWMTQQRLDAWDAYAAYAPEALAQQLETLQPFCEPPTARVLSQDWPAQLQYALDERGDEEGLIVQRDSTILSRSISKEYTKKGVVFTDLDTAIQSVPDLVMPFIGKLATHKDPRQALGAALWSGGTFLYVPEHVHVRLPFHSCLWMHTSEVGIFSRAVIVVEKGSHVVFVDECVSADWDRPGLAVEVVETFVRPQSDVECLRLYHCGTNAGFQRYEMVETLPTARYVSRDIPERLNSTLERAALLYPEIRV